MDKDLIKFRSKKILLAHSGGLDSCVLADILLDLKACLVKFNVLEFFFHLF